jgi:hypothetical protein
MWNESLVTCTGSAAMGPTVMWLGGAILGEKRCRRSFASRNRGTGGLVSGIFRIGGGVVEVG